MQAQGFLADGEITDSHFYIWDLLSVNDTDLRIQPYEIRYVHLTQHFRGVSDVLRVCETAMTTKAKRDFREKNAQRERRRVRLQEPERRVRGRTSRTALQVQVRRHGILHRWPEAREKGE